MRRFRHHITRALVCMAVWCGSPFLCADHDVCEEADYTFAIMSPSEIAGHLEIPVLPGDEGSIDITIRLRTGLIDGPKSINGWSLSVVHDEDLLTLEEVSNDGTHKEELNGVFSMTEPASNAEVMGFVSSVFATCGVGPCLIAPETEYDLVRARYRYQIPADFESPIQTSIRIQDGLVGSGQAISSVLTINGGSVIPCMTDLKIHFRIRPSSPFFRGDANFDGQYNISDPATVLRALFFGDATIWCDDAADANDDGILNVSDAVYSFNYLFVGGPPPLPPFPDTGTDPTEDTLFCYP